MIFIELDHFIHCFFRSVATLLGLFDLLGVAPLLDDEVEDVEHVEIVVCSLGAALWEVVCFETPRLTHQKCSATSAFRLVGSQSLQECRDSL